MESELKEIFTPLSDAYMSEPWNIRVTIFRFGPMEGMFILKDLSKLSKQATIYLKQLITFRGNKIFPKRFVLCAVFNDTHAYYLDTTDKEQDAWKSFDIIIKELKEGKEVEIVDYAGYQHPLKISYKGVSWIW